MIPYIVLAWMGNMGLSVGPAFVRPRPVEQAARYEHNQAGFLRMSAPSREIERRTPTTSEYLSFLTIH